MVLLHKMGFIATASAILISAGIVIYKRNHYDQEGYNGYGYNRLGRDRDGYDQAGYDPEGYDRDGFDSTGWDREGYSRYGFNKSGYNRNGYDWQGFDRHGYNPAGIDRSGNSREEAELIIREVESMKEKAWYEMKSNGFREALTNIRTGLDHCLKLVLYHKTDKRFERYNTSLQERINRCQYYNLFDNEYINKLQEARRQSNSIHELRLNKEFNDVYFCYKILEDLIDKTRKQLDIKSLNDTTAISI